MSDKQCKTCLDWVDYCTCWIGEDRELSDSGEFTITDGKLTATWNPKTRQLSGDQKLFDKILSQFSNQKENLENVGVLWMEQREPVAVAIVSRRLGLKLSGDAPEA